MPNASCASVTLGCTHNGLTTTWWGRQTGSATSSSRKSLNAWNRQAFILSLLECVQLPAAWSSDHRPMSGWDGPAMFLNAFKFLQSMIFAHRRPRVATRRFDDLRDVQTACRVDPE